MNRKELIQRLDAVEAEMQALLAKDVNDTTDDDETQLEALELEHKKITARIKAIDNLNKSKAVMDEGIGRISKPSKPDADFVSSADRIRQVEITCEELFPTAGDFLRAVRMASNPENAGHDLLQKLSNHNKTIQAATGMSEGIPSEGGYLVSPQMQSEIEQRVFSQENIPGRCRTVTIGQGSNAFMYPMVDETSRANGTRNGGLQSYWTGEADTLTASQTKFKTGRLPLDKITVLTYATEELLEDTTALMNWYQTEVPAEFDFKLTDGIINGTGAGMPLGILNSVALVTVAKESGQSATTLLAKNIMKMYARHKNPSRAVWLINQDVWPQIFQFSLEVGTGGAPLFIPAGSISLAPFGTLFGRPIIPIEQCKTLGTVGDIVFADLSSYLIIRKNGIKNASSIHVKFTTDEQAFRWTYRINGQPVYNNFVTPFNGTNTISEFVALATRA